MSDEKESTTRSTDGSPSISKAETDKVSGVFSINITNERHSTSVVAEQRAVGQASAEQTPVGEASTGQTAIGKTSPVVSTVPRIRTALKSREEKDGISSRAASPGLPKVTFDASTDKGKASLHIRAFDLCKRKFENVGLGKCSL